MSAGYKYVTWTRAKIGYDLVLLVGVALYCYLFIKIAPQFWTGEARVNGQIIQMRAYGTCAFLMLTLILCIGPLARLNTRFLPLLYNRRHFGVLTFLIGGVHAKKVLDWYHGYGDLSPLMSLMVTITEGSLGSFTGFPFELLGILALIILCLMAVTSHDFWLNFLSPKVWKALHMSVYVVYGLLVMHISLGALQSERSLFYALILGVSIVLVAGLHLVAGYREWHKDRVDAAPSTTEHWLDVGVFKEIPMNRAKIVHLDNGERVAVFRYDNKLSAVSNVCAHQNGPLGEGRVMDGCITCPWHGFQYVPHTGQSPPPFEEKIPTFRLKLDGDRVLLDTRALPPGTPVNPVLIEEQVHG
ncbi:MAG: ferric reductase-like transmembrane domain-containing protein [Gammaproteobacteria bacterium]|nr:ferric reductase-like transmembrane domain-containing protein [Gammaproteobacteria bacterium]